MLPRIEYEVNKLQNYLARKNITVSPINLQTGFVQEDPCLHELQLLLRNEHEMNVLTYKIILQEYKVTDLLRKFFKLFGLA